MMLLLLISLFSNYHCNEVGQANLKKAQLSAQMHRSIGKIDTLLRDIQQEIRKQKSVLRAVDLEDNLKDVRTLNYSIAPVWREGASGVDEIRWNNPNFPHWMNKSSYTPPHLTTKLNLWKNLRLLPIILNSSAGPLDDVSGERPDHPDYSLNQAIYTFPSENLTFPQGKLRDGLNAFTTVNSSFFTRPAYPFSLNLDKPALKEGLYEDYMPGSPSTWMELSRPTLLPNDTDTRKNAAGATRPWPASNTIIPVSTLSPSPPLSLGLREPFAYNPKLNIIFNFFTVSKRMKERTNYAQNKRITKANRITSITHRPRQIEKARRTSGGRTKGVLRTSVPDPLPITETAAGLLKEDREGFLYVTLPASISEIVTGPTTYAGNVLYNAHKFKRPSSVARRNQKYHDLMDEWDEGYMMTFLLQVTRVVSREKEKEVREVFHHAEFIMNWFLENAEIAFAGKRITNMAIRICRFCSEAGTHHMGVLQSYASMFNQVLKERNTAMSFEVNSMIDNADLMYKDDEGEELFDAIREFEEYPNTVGLRTSQEICLHLITAFLRPYKRLQSSARWRRLRDSINKILEQRFGERGTNEELVMLGDTATTKPTHSRGKLKRRSSLKRLLINRTKHRDSNEDTHRRQTIRATKYPMLRSVLPITRHQKRFRVITPRQLRSNAYLNNDRPTEDYFYKKNGKPIHPPNRIMQFFPHATNESENKRRMQPNDRSIKEYFYKRRHCRANHPPNGMLQFFPQATKESENKRRMLPTEAKIL